MLLPSQEYEDQIDMSSLPTLARFLLKSSQRHFSKITSDSSHPLFVASFLTTVECILETSLCTDRRDVVPKNMPHFFSNLFMSESNKWFTCIYMYRPVCFFIHWFFIYVHIQYYCSGDRGCLIKWIWIRSVHEVHYYISMVWLFNRPLSMSGERL